MNFLGPARNARTQVLNSFGLGYRLVGTDTFKDRVLTGADTLFGFRWQVWLLQQLRPPSYFILQMSKFSRVRASQRNIEVVVDLVHEARMPPLKLVSGSGGKTPRLQHD